MWILSKELAAWHPSDTQDFEMASRFLENFHTAALSSLEQNETTSTSNLR